MQMNYESFFSSASMSYAPKAGTAFRRGSNGAAAASRARSITASEIVILGRE
jgi:hypothetical protein